MAKRPKFQVGERVQVFCDAHTQTGRLQKWVDGTVVSVDRRMVEVACDMDVYDATGRRRTDRRLWCAHGSRRLRRTGEAEDR